MTITIKDYNGKDVLAIITPLNKRHKRIQPLRQVPKSWEKIGCYFTSLNNLYNQSLMVLYKCKDGLRFSMYRDGCFYEYCGRIAIQ